MVAHASTFFAKHAKAMSLIHHDRAVILLLQSYYLWQVGKVAFHREHTVYNNQFNSLVWQFLENFLQVFHIIMLVFELMGKRESSSIHDAGMVALVTDNIILTSTNHRQYS